MTSHRVLAVVPVYGHVRMTHDLLEDLDAERDLVDVVVVDNGGEYKRRRDETVLVPGRNLGWAGGTNLGTSTGRRPEHTAVLWINNDTRLSSGFTRSLLGAAEQARAGIVGPLYDCHWYHQRADAGSDTQAYKPRPRHFLAPFIDGTAMLVTAATLDQIGLLDAERFAPLGWGAEIDYCLTARAAGRRVVVTQSAFLHHERSVTAKAMFADGYQGYLDEAFPRAVDGLAAKWGDDWRERMGVDPVTLQTPGRRRRDLVPVRSRLTSLWRP